MRLRPYQRQAITAAFREWKRVRSTLFVCPTGGGKSLVFSRIAERFRPRGRTLVVADREWLVTQAAENINAHTPVTAAIEMADQRVHRGMLPDVVCASVQSLNRRLSDFAPDSFGLIVIDEADLAMAPTYRKILDHFAGAKVLGVTATPDRGDRQPLGELFESVCLSVEIGDLIRGGYLAPIRQRSVKVLDLTLATVRDGDFTDASLERILTEERHLHEVVKPTLDLHRGRPTLVFATSIKHAEALAGVFNRYRPGSARSIHGEPTAKGKKRNRDTVDAFLRGEFPILCNCALLLRGVDLPPVACIAMARPTQSRALYTQALGRGTRLHPGKADLLVLDFGDNASTHSLVTAVDILGGKRTEEARERAREMLDEEPDGDVLDVLDRAEGQLAADEELRARVIAKVKYRTKARGGLGIDWDAQPLGKEPDRSLARKLGVTYATVRWARVARGISSTSRRGDAEPVAKDSRIGKVPDRVLAEEYAVSVSAVALIRKRLGIAPAITRRDQGIVKIAKAALLNDPRFGQVSDGSLAREYGVSQGTVNVLRRKIGKTSATGKHQTKLATIDWSTVPLGGVPDRIIAADLGVPAHTVARVRKSKGIAPFGPVAVGVDWDSQPLGNLTDAAIAARLGVSAKSVSEQRRRRGIPIFARQ